MPLSQKQLDQQGVPISFQPRGKVMVRVGPCSATSWQEAKIPLDGRRYICAGELILRNGRRVRAHFEVRTDIFDFLDRESVWCTLDGDLWYQIDEPEFAEALGLSRAEIVPYRWQPDRPLDYHEPAPYSMMFPDDEGQD